MASATGTPLQHLQPLLRAVRRPPSPLGCCRAHSAPDETRGAGVGRQVRPPLPGDGHLHRAGQPPFLHPLPPLRRPRRGPRHRPRRRHAREVPRLLRVPRCPAAPTLRRAAHAAVHAASLLAGPCGNNPPSICLWVPAPAQPLFVVGPTFVRRRTWHDHPRGGRGAECAGARALMGAPGPESLQASRE